MNFITALGQMTLAGAFASWYFAFKKPQDVPTFALTAAFFRSFYHFGTMAFGALIIAIIQILRSILNYIERKTERYSRRVQCYGSMYQFAYQEATGKYVAVPPRHGLPLLKFEMEFVQVLIQMACICKSLSLTQSMALINSVIIGTHEQRDLVVWE